MVGVQRDAVHGADLAALRFVKVAHAFGAFVGVDFVDLRAGRDGAVGAFGLAYVAVDAFVRDEEGHDARVCFEGLGVSAVDYPDADNPRPLRRFSVQMPSHMFFAA